MIRRLRLSGALLLAAAALAVAGVPVAAHSQVLQKLGNLEVGGKAPDFSGLDFDERVFHLASVLEQRKGGPRFVIVSFWATTCKHCRKGLVALERVAAEMGREGVQVVLVSCDPELEPEAGNGGAEALTAALLGWLDGAGLQYHRKKRRHLWLLWDPGLAIAKRYQVFADGELTLPHTFVVSRKGRIAKILAGEGDDFEQVVRRAVEVPGRRGGKKDDGRKTR